MNKLNFIHKLIDGHNQSQFLALSTEQQQQIIAILRFEGLLARLAHFLSEDQIDSCAPHIKRHLLSAKLQADRLAHFCRNEAEIIHKALAKKGIKGTFLKGAAYALMGTDLLKGRQFTDIDLLVSKPELEPAELTLMSFGWLQKVMDNYDEKYYREWAHEIPPMIHRKRDTVIDLHHNLVPPISGRAPDVEIFTQNALSVASGQVLRPAALVLHSMIHLFTNEEFHNAYRDLNDIHLMLTHFSNEAFWSDITSLALDANFEDELYLGLIQSTHYFATDIPEQTLQTVQAAAQKNRSRLTQRLITKAYQLAVSPKHPSQTDWRHNVCLAFCFVRGHLVKMPLKVLTKHMTFKTYRLTIEYLFGKGFGKEQTNKQ